MARDLKKTVQRALETNALESLAVLAKEDRKVLSALVRLAYDKDQLIGWRAIKAIGLAAREMVEADYEFLRVTIRKLLWSLSDESGGIGWSAPEILGEIVSADPRRFDDIIPLIVEVYDIEEKTFRPGVLYALSVIASKEPDLVLPFKDLIARALSEGDPLSRIYAIDLFRELKGRIGKDELDGINKARKAIESDRSEAWVYRKDGFVNVGLNEYIMSNK